MSIIMVVDDNTSIRKAISFVLKKDSFEIIEAINGQDAVDKAQNMMPDLIVMDFKMPTLNGWDAAKKLKSIESTKDIPIVGYTAYASGQHIEEGLKAGCAEIIKKPIDLEDLKKIIKKYLKN